jgi:hypothetical protein
VLLDGVPESAEFTSYVTVIGAVYVNPPVEVALPAVVVTTTFFAPAVPAGVLNVTLVAVLDLIEVAETPPTVIAVTPVRFVPVIVVAVPPAVGPLVVLNDEIVGPDTPTLM